VGGSNHKEAGNPVPVELLDDGGPRYSLAELLEVAKRHKIVATESKAVSVDGVDPGRAPSAKLMQLLDSLDEFKKAWDHKPRKMGESDWSLSEWDLALANCMVAAGWNDQEIANTLALHRERFDPGNTKNTREDYFAATVRKARNYRYVEHREQEQEEAAERLEEVARDPESATPEQTLAFFHKLVGGPEIKEFVQYGRDAESVRFKLVLADGREVQLGDSASLLSQPKFAANYLPATGHVIPTMKGEKWKNIIQGLMNAVALVESEDDGYAGRAIQWVNDYTERRFATDKDLACANNDPFRTGDEVFISLGKLSQWIRRQRGERVADADIRQYLLAAGFERTTVNYIKPDGKKSTRSYFHAHRGVLE
jgi:hypothetical protein